VEGLTLVFLALLAGVVLYLVLSQRNFQRIDYSHLLKQEDQERQLTARLKQAEDLLATLREYEHSRKLDLERFVAAAKQELATEIAAARGKIIAEVLDRPGAYDMLLLADTGVAPTPPRSPQPQPQPRSVPERNASLGQFRRSPHQQRIAEMLECGFTHQEVSRDLGVSRTEVELVSSIIFSERTA
jgi:signal transduction histidine kinase